MWEEYGKYKIGDDLKFEDKYFYIESKESKVSETIKLYRLFLLLLQAKINDPKNVDVFVEQMIRLYRDSKTEMKIKKEKVAENIWRALERLPKVKREDLLSTYTKVLYDIELDLYINLELKANNKEAANRVGMLYKIAKVRWGMARLLFPITYSIHHCFRCKQKNSIPILLNCGHIFCKECLGLWCIMSFVAIPIKELMIKCPNYDPNHKCNYFLSNIEINQVIKDTVYYDKYVKKKYDFKCKEQICAICGEDGKNHGLLAMDCDKDPKDEEAVTSRRVCAECAEQIHGEQIKKKKCDCFCANCKEEKKEIRIVTDDGYCHCGKCNKDKEKLFITCKCGCLYCNDCILHYNSCLCCDHKFKDANGNLRDEYKKIVLADSKKRKCPFCPHIENAKEEESKYEFKSCSKCKASYCTVCQINEEAVKGHGKSYHAVNCKYHDEDNTLNTCRKCTKDNPCPKSNYQPR